MDFTRIEKILENEPAFRLKQIKKAVFQDLAASWDKVLTLPQSLRQKLSENCPIDELEAEEILTSADNRTTKVLFKLRNGSKIESVLMKHDSTNSPQASRNTVCVSSQAGCSLGCKFCATGRQGFKKNLSVFEIINQVLYFARLLKKNKERVGDEVYPFQGLPSSSPFAVARVAGVVFMGMGEPFLNYKNVLGAIKILNDKDGLNLGARHISISTAGIIEGIKKLSEEPFQVNLAISLHAPNNELRTKIMPINKTYPIEAILSAVDHYIKKTNRRVMFEYLMINGINDSPKEAKELAELMKKRLYLVNLISYNPISHSEFKSTPGWKIKEFKNILKKNKIAFTQRYRFGREIKAACGQLTDKE